MRDGERALVRPGAVLQVNYKGRPFICYVDSADGGGQEYRIPDIGTYRSLSTAATAVIQAVNPDRETFNQNGWTFWSLRDPENLERHRGRN